MSVEYATTCRGLSARLNEHYSHYWCTYMKSQDQLSHHMLTKSLVESIQLYEHSHVEAAIASGVLGLKHSIPVKENMSSSTFTLRTCTETMHCTTTTWGAVHALLYWSVVDAQRDSATRYLKQRLCTWNLYLCTIDRMLYTSGLLGFEQPIFAVALCSSSTSCISACTLSTHYARYSTINRENMSYTGCSLIMARVDKCQLAVSFACSLAAWHTSVLAHHCDTVAK